MTCGRREVTVRPKQWLLKVEQENLVVTDLLCWETRDVKCCCSVCSPWCNFFFFFAIELQEVTALVFPRAVLKGERGI